MKIDSVKCAWFSPTGTTRKIVETVAEGLGYEGVEKVDFTTGKGRQSRLRAGERDLLIIGVPVYIGRVPHVAVEWLKTLEARETPAVCMVVYGNRAFDDALLELKDLAVSRGCVPVACAAFIGEHSYSGPDTPIAPGRPDEADLGLARIFAQKVRERLDAAEAVGDYAEIVVPGNYPYMDMKENREIIAGADFIQVADTCVKCGVCADVCPVDAIDRDHVDTVMVKECIKCCACIKSCPTGARTVKEGIIRSIAVRLSGACRQRKEPILFL